MKSILQLTIKSTEYINRRNVLSENILKKYCNKNHVIVLPAADIQYKTLHIPQPYHQDTSFNYYTGFMHKKAMLLMAFNNYSSKTTLFIDQATQEDILWNGPYPSRESAEIITGITEIEYNNNFQRIITSLLQNKENSMLWTINPVNAASFDQHIHAMSKLIEPMNLSTFIDSQRIIKSPSEIEILRKAVFIASEALKSSFSFTKPLMNEQEILAKLFYEVNIRGAKLAYPPVIAGGKRANIIHYLDSNRYIEDNELVLVDVGADVLGYYSDLTRTWPVNGRFTKEQGILYDILNRVLSDCIEVCFPDKSLSDMHRFMLKQLNKYIKEEKIVNNSADVYQYCPHHIGHYLGLDIHDTSTVSSLVPLLPGTVFPMEPALYLSENDANVDPLYRGIGMRLEDDFLMTESGVDCLSSDLPRTRTEIEKLCNPTVTEMLADFHQ